MGTWGGRIGTFTYNPSKILTATDAYVRPPGGGGADVMALHCLTEVGSPRSSLVLVYRFC